MLLALSANSPFWRADATGLASTRTPIFRAFPRVGIPPTYEDWADYERRIEFMVESRVIEDYTYLWYDVRPHPELRHRRGPRDGRPDARGAHARPGRAGPGAGEGAGRALRRRAALALPFEMLDENKWLAARHGLEGELVDLPSSERVATARWLAGCSTACASTRRTSARTAELDGVEDLLERGNGAQRQVVVYEANHDLREVVAEIVAATAPNGGPRRRCAP